MPLISNAKLPVARDEVSPSLFIRAFHRMQEQVRAPVARQTLAKLIGRFRPSADVSESPADRELAVDGVTFLPSFLSVEQSGALYDLLSGFPCQDPWKMERGTFDLENAPEGTHVADIPAAPTIKALHDIAFDDRLIHMAARYFGCRPYVDSVQAWWSLSGNSEPEEAENFHRDNDSIRFLKFFLYLTDVDDLKGPHRFVKKSHVEAKALERRRLTDQEVKAAFGEDRILSITGRAGDAFMEDTFGVHKGQLPQQGRRLLVQVRYSIMPSVFQSRTLIAGAAPVTSPVADSLLHYRGSAG